MQQHNLIQGSPEWLAYRANHDNASDAPAMLGCSPYKTREQLLHERHTGLTADVDAATQNRFDDGHRFEALARPLGEKIIGEELYPVVGSKGNLSASFDGLTMLEDIAFEHKSLNNDLRAVMVDGCAGDCLPMHYQVQMEQQCMVSGCKKVLFMASKWQGDELVEERHCWYTPNPDLAAKIRAGWAQFAEDLAAFVPTERAIAPVASAVTALPAVAVQVSGSIAVKTNFSAFETALRDFIDNRLIRKPESDQDFADLGLQIKALSNAEAALNAAEVQMLSQVEAVDLAKRTKDMLFKLARDNRLMAEKLLDARKEQIKIEQVQRGRDELASHISALNTRLGKPYMPAIAADFAGAIKGKRTVDSLRDAINTTLANAKIEASAVADRIQINLNTLRELAKDHAFLFSDTPSLVLKDSEHVTVLVKQRIAEHQQAEADRLEAERERIRKEEAERLEREAADARRVAQSQAEAAIRVPQPAGEPPAPIPPNPAPAARHVVRTEPAREVVWINTATLSERLNWPISAAICEELGYPGIKRQGPGMWWDASKVEAIGRAAMARIRVAIEAMAIPA